jgi:NADH-quinone oxidoreductase subunit K
MTPDIPLNYFIYTSAILFFTGLFGFFSSRNKIAMLISLMLMFNAIMINFAAFNTYLFNRKIEGIQSSIILIGITLCEAAVAIALIVKIQKQQVSHDRNNSIKNKS